MKIRDALERVINIGSNNASQTVRAFLYGGQEDASRLTAEARKVLKLEQLRGDNFAFLGEGDCNVALGNEKLVLKLEMPTYRFTPPLDKVPPELQAEIVATGVCNGIKYTIEEALDTKKPIILDDVLSFLFKAKEAGITYSDPNFANFGYDRQGNFKTLDIDHFCLYTPEIFSESVQYALYCASCDKVRLPFIGLDETHTYLAFDRSAPKDLLTAIDKKLRASLQAAGIGEEAIEAVPSLPVYRIAATEIRYGHPPQSQDLADYLEQALALDKLEKTKAKPPSWEQNR
jgi:hypothetical protein